MEYTDYTIIPMGDHCATALALKELGLRECSYPFDWVCTEDQLHDTNIVYNFQLLKKLTSDSMKTIVHEYIGNALQTTNKLNAVNHIMFPHDLEDPAEVISKYERRFTRLLEHITTKKIVCILLTRAYYISEDVMLEIINTLKSFNQANKIIFISGVQHTYLETKPFADAVEYYYIYYDTAQYWNYDYSHFRPQLQILLKSIFGNKNTLLESNH